MSSATEAIEPLTPPTNGTASVPRRFGMGVMLILVTAFAVLFAAMQSFGAHPYVFFAIAGVFLSVTLAQIVLFQGKSPRWASVLAGAVSLPILVFGIEVADRYTTAAGRQHHGPWGVEVLPSMLCASIGGAILGYLAGCVMAGIFYLMDRYSRRHESKLHLQLQPFLAEDVETLLAWLQMPGLAARWSLGRLAEPCDRESLAQFALTEEADGARRWRFKAVVGEEEQMVGYAELVLVDPERRLAEIRNALVDPSISHRAWHSQGILRALIRKAFSEAKLNLLCVRTLVGNEQTIECLNRAGFQHTWVEWPEVDGSFATIPVGMTMVRLGLRPN